jgi:hypothetical protein
MQRVTGLHAEPDPAQAVTANRCSTRGAALRLPARGVPRPCRQLAQPRAAVAAHAHRNARCAQPRGLVCYAEPARGGGLPARRAQRGVQPCAARQRAQRAQGDWEPEVEFEAPPPSADEGAALPSTSRRGRLEVEVRALPRPGARPDNRTSTVTVWLHNSGGGLDVHQSPLPTAQQTDW